MDTNNNAEIKQESSALDSTEIKNNETVDAEKLSLTQEELDKIIDKRLKREKQKFEKEKTEVERLAKLSEEERAKAEFEKEKQKFEEERKKFARKNLELELVKQLSEKNIDTKFSKFLITDDAESTLENLKSFEKAFNEALEKKVKERIKETSYTPPKTENTTSGSVDFVSLIKENQAKRN